MVRGDGVCLWASVVLLAMTTTLTKEVPWARHVRFHRLHALASWTAGGSGAQSTTAEATELPAPEPDAGLKPRPGSGGPASGWGEDDEGLHPEFPKQAAAESQAEAGGTPGSMRDKKLIIYVAGSRGPGAGGRLGPSLLLTPAAAILYCTNY